MTLARVIVLALQTSIVMTVLGFGLIATFGDVLSVLRRPGLLARSLLAILVIMPIVAVVASRLLSLRPSVEIALVALSIAPIPPLLPGKERKAGVHEGYGLGLLVIVGALAIITVPASIVILGGHFTRPFVMPSGAITKIVLMTILVPMLSGMAINELWPAIAARLAKPIGLIAKILLATSGVVLLAGRLPTVFALMGGGSILGLAGFIVLGLAVGHVMGGPNPDDRVALALSTASRHPAIAITVAKANFPDDPNVVAAIFLYLLLTVVIEMVYVARWKKA